MSAQWSVAMTGRLHDELRSHLLRPDGEEDVCVAVYQPSEGTERSTALLGLMLKPGPGERHVHGNASFTSEYVLRGAREAAQKGAGVALLHSHPRGRGWQMMSETDRTTEASYANLVREVTGLPMVGMTLTGLGTWSARTW